eukprot:UC1_evm2s677
MSTSTTPPVVVLRVYLASLRKSYGSSVTPVVWLANFYAMEPSVRLASSEPYAIGQIC